ncbi:glycoside hydrolase superfamily [Lactifluus volemus]|nr:glycoside hydrolase superfamily [Lactifluus volemus]
MWWISASLLGFVVQVALAAHPQCVLVARPTHGRFNPSASSVSPQGTKAHSSTSTAPTSTPTPFTPFPYYTKPVRGVGLGGWFMLEDENTALAALQRHWNTWITEDDFVQMAAAGLTHSSIGYWHVPTNASVVPYVPGGWPYIKRALGWARQHNIHVILDVHGAPGSQNGFDNSGQHTNTPQCDLEVIKVIATEVGSQVDAIELLNEIAGFLGPQWNAAARTFYQSGYDVVRQAAGDNVVVVIGDTFDALSSWQGLLDYPQATRAMMDVHRYQLFSDGELTRTLDQHVQFSCQTILPELRGYASTTFGRSTTDCAMWLNGRGTGSRWEGTFGGGPAIGSCTGYTGNYSTFSQDLKTTMRKYWEAQVEVAEAVQGWLFWTWKTESADEWSYSKGLEGGWIPRDPTQRLYPGLCN